MELRPLRSFLMIAREGTISGAAKVLHISQPALSIQMKELELELGCTLFARGSRRIELTPAGIRLRKRAEEILDLVERTETDFHIPGETIAGEVRIGCGETPGIALIAEVVAELQNEYPLLRFDLFSANGPGVSERLDTGRIDFGLFVGEIDRERYEAIELPVHDTWGVIMRTEDALAQKETVSATDLLDRPLIISKQALPQMAAWFERDLKELDVAVTYTLLYNAAVMVQQGIGYAISLDGLVTGPNKGDALTFRPLNPPLCANIYIAWKRYQSFSAVASVFLDRIRERWG